MDIGIWLQMVRNIAGFLVYLYAEPLVYAYVATSASNDILLLRLTPKQTLGVQARYETPRHEHK